MLREAYEDKAGITNRNVSQLSIQSTIEVTERAVNDDTHIPNEPKKAK